MQTMDGKVSRSNEHYEEDDQNKTKEKQIGRQVNAMQNIQTRKN